jgi:putative ATP-binding cassette transporter
MIPSADATAPFLEQSLQSGRSFRFLRLALGFWTGETRGRAWLLTSAVLVFLIANLAAAISVNLWNKFFFDALEQKDSRAVVLSIALILGLAAFSAASAVGGLHARMRLQMQWRQWLAQTLISRWLKDRHFYQLTIVPTAADNPEARIAEDGRLAIELLVDFSLGVLNAILASASFIGILWVVGGSLTMFGFEIPGYMVWVCIGYSALTTVSMLLMGRPLVQRVEEKAASEAQLRYELTRVKDNAETIALTGGDEDERDRLNVTLAGLVQRWYRVMIWQGRMTWLSGSSLVMAPVVPLLLGAPKYLSGEMSLGSLMQAATAFTQVLVALNWLSDNALRLADWFASSHRVTQLSDAIESLEVSLGTAQRTDTIKLGASPDDRIHLRRLRMALHDGG